MSSWPERLAPENPERGTAIQELREILVRGLRSGLSGRAGADHAFVDDVVQDALLRTLDRLHLYQGHGRFTSWALAISFRVAFNELRRREWRHISLEQLLEDQGHAAQTEDPSADPEKETADRDLVHFLRSVIQTDLTPRQRTTLLYELDGVPQQEIAQLLKTNRNNVYKLAHDARKALKRALEARGYTPLADAGTAELMRS